MRHLGRTSFRKQFCRHDSYVHGLVETPSPTRVEYHREESEARKRTCAIAAWADGFSRKVRNHKERWMETTQAREPNLYPRGFPRDSTVVGNSERSHTKQGLDRYISAYQRRLYKAGGQNCLGAVHAS